jgi:hypothetical protein
MRRRIAVAPQPDPEQLAIIPGVGVQRRQPVDVGLEDLGLRRGDDLEISATLLRLAQRINAFVQPELRIG